MLRDELRGLGDWLRLSALPLWSDTGWDAHLQLFHERLTLGLVPDAAAPRRLMVQARQVSVFAHPSQLHTHELALTAARSMTAAYHRRDGSDGWIFSLDADGKPLRTERDLYTHAFVLYAMAAVLRLRPHDPLFSNAVADTLSYLDTRMAEQAGGYAECVPRTNPLRRQDPHMHLLEALQELFLATSDPAYLSRADALVDLALRRFIDPDSGALRELFEPDWTVYPAPGSGLLEPGHHFEWGWLLQRHREMTGSAAGRGQDAAAAAARLVTVGIEAGLDEDTGRVLDALDERRSVVRASSRLWPHCEALRSLAAAAGQGNERAAALALPVVQRMRALYLPARLRGGWIDQLDERDEPASTMVPASSLYHVFHAYREAARVWQVNDAG